MVFITLYKAVLGRNEKWGLGVFFFEKRGRRPFQTKKGAKVFFSKKKGVKTFW